MFSHRLRPGQGFQSFTIMRDGGGYLSSSGTVMQNRIVGETIKGIISQASQREKDEWKQAGHPITHTIVQKGNRNRANAGDFLSLSKRNESGEAEPQGRYFYIQGTHDPGELGHFTVYYVEERLDME